MQKLISELNRLYIPAGSFSPELFAQQLDGSTSLAVHLASDDGMTRAVVIAFPQTPDSADGHWMRLCAMANGLQGQLGLPAPAVSVSGKDAYGLWLSLAAPTPVAQVQAFLALLHQAYLPGIPVHPEAALLPVPLLPGMHQGTGKWGAFIHPGLGASFIDEMGLEMAPPLAAQTAFLEGLQSISEAQFQHALAVLQAAHGHLIASNMSVQAPAAASVSTHSGLLLQDATLEDIIQHLHSKNIEPTFRHIVPS
jgi:hypothetical protein